MVRDNGGVLSPYLIIHSIYVRDLLKTVTESSVGCTVAGIFVTPFCKCGRYGASIYAPSWIALPELIELLESVCSDYGIVCNAKKIVCRMCCLRESYKHIALSLKNYAI
jgi:hypothetical protein